MKNRFILGDIVEEVIEFIVTTTPTPLPLTYDFLKKHGFRFSKWFRKTQR